MTPFEQYLLAHINELCRNTGRPARPVALVARTGLPDRSLRRYLHGLEERGLIRRATPRTGWIVVGSALDRRIAAARDSRALAFFRQQLGWDYKTAIWAAA